MANVKFSQFTSAASLSATGQIVGFDGVNNIRLTKAALEGSLDLGNLAGSIDLLSQVSNSLAPANGGTGLNGYSQGDILYGDSSSELSRLAAGAAGQVLTTNGAGADPSWTTPTVYSNISIYRDVWQNAGDFGYINIPRGFETITGLELNTVNYTTYPTSGITRAKTDSVTTPLPAGVSDFWLAGRYTIWTLEAGTYEIKASSFFFDNFSDLDAQIFTWIRNVGAAWNASTDKYLLIKESTVEASDSKIFEGSIFVTLAAQSELILTMRFDNGGADPFPAIGDNRYALELEITRH